MKRILGIVAVTILMACNQKEKPVQESVKVVSKTAAIDVEISDQKKLKIFQQYEVLKNDLVKSDGVSAQKSAAALQISLAAYKGCEPTAELADRIATHPDLVSQRKNFTVLSADLIALAKNTEIEKGTLYVQHCPMANKGDGGDWLSTEKEIKNPYYGDEMLSCGRITEELKAK